MFDNTELLCLHCGRDMTHHVAVDIHVRVKEDATTYTHRVYDVPLVMRDSVTLKDNQPTPPPGRNPSGRRDGVTIVYCCENCGKHSKLTIGQHKGQTFLNCEKI